MLVCVRFASRSKSGLARAGRAHFGRSVVRDRRFCPIQDQSPPYTDRRRFGCRRRIQRQSRRQRLSQPGTHCSGSNRCSGIRRSPSNRGPAGRVGQCRNTGCRIRQHASDPCLRFLPGLIQFRSTGRVAGRRLVARVPLLPLGCGCCR